MKKATSKTRTMARASRLCARPGDKLARMKCCSSGTTAALFTIAATLRSGWNARHEDHTASSASSQADSVRRHFCPLGRLRTSKEASRPLKRLDRKSFLRRRMSRQRPTSELFFAPSFRLSPVRLDTQRDLSVSRLRVEIDVWLGSRLCENSRGQGRRRIVFSIAFFRQKLPVQLVFRFDEIETEILHAS